MVQLTPAKLDDGYCATMRALSSLNQHDAAAVRTTVRLAGNRYGVEQHDDYDGYLSLLLTSLDDDGAGFLVSGRTGAIDLAELLGDEMTPIGRFSNMGAALVSLRAALDRRGPACRARPHAEPGDEDR